MPELKFRDIVSRVESESSKAIKERVCRARRIQLERFCGTRIYAKWGRSWKSDKIFQEYSLNDTRMTETVIGNFFDAFHVIDQSGETWIKAGRLAYDLKKKGKTILLLDCYLAVLANENACAIFTLNRHFKEIRDIAGITLW